MSRRTLAIAAASVAGIAIIVFVAWPRSTVDPAPPAGPGKTTSAARTPGLAAVDDAAADMAFDEALRLADQIADPAAQADLAPRREELRHQQELLNGLVARIRQTPRDYDTFRLEGENQYSVRLLDASPRCLFVRIEGRTREVPWKDVHPSQFLSLVRDYWPDIEGNAVLGLAIWAARENMTDAAAELTSKRAPKHDPLEDQIAPILANAQRALAAEDTILARAHFERALVLKADDARAIAGLARTAELERAIAARPKPEPRPAPEPEPEPQPEAKPAPPVEEPKPPEPKAPPPLDPPGKETIFAASPPKDGESAALLSCSPSGTTVAWIFREGNRKGVAINGKKGELFEEVPGPCLWMRRDVPVYVAARDGKLYVVAGTERQDGFHMIDGLVVSESGNTHAYRGGTRGAGREIFAIVVNGTRKDFLHAYPPVFPPGSEYPAYGAYVPVQGGDPRAIFVAEGRTRVLRIECSPNLSRAPRRLVYVEEVWATRTTRDHRLVRDGVVISSGHGGGSDPVLSDDGESWAFVGHVATSSDQYVVHNGRRGPECAYVRPPVLSGDGKSIAYFASRRNAGWFVMHNGREYGPYQAIVDARPAMSADGRRIAWRALSKANGEPVVVVDGAAITGYDRVTPPVFSADGRTVSFGAQRDRTFVWRTVELK